MVHCCRRGSRGTVRRQSLNTISMKEKKKLILTLNVAHRIVRLQLTYTHTTAWSYS